MMGWIIGLAVTGGVGVLLVVLGLLLWKRERITLMQDYHVDKVSPENRRAFCRLAGLGLLVMGGGLLLTALLFALTESPWSFLCFALTLIPGLGMLTRAVNKYNI